MTAARIRRLTLTNFRSYHAAQIEVGAAPVVLVGPNGAGKTNLIEAISLLAPGRGLAPRHARRRGVHRRRRLLGGVGRGRRRARPRHARHRHRAAGGEDAAPTRKCRIDREPVSSATAFADHLRVIWLVPAMDGLFNGPASERRRFLDRLVLAVDAEHGSRVNALERALRSRNRLLEDAAPRSALARRHRARDRGARGRGRRRCGPRRSAGCRPRSPRAARTSAFPGRRDRARRLDGAARRRCIRRSRSRTAIAPCSRTTAPATPPPAARSTGRI